MDYDIESYWSGVAVEIRRRGTGNCVAGDDDPYYRYKRNKFLRRFLAALDVTGQRVLELGCGPGGNLLELARRAPASLVGIDISASMLALAGQNLEGCSVELKKTDGQRLPLRIEPSTWLLPLPSCSTTWIPPGSAGSSPSCVASLAGSS